MPPNLRPDDVGQGPTQQDLSRGPTRRLAAGGAKEENPDRATAERAAKKQADTAMHERLATEESHLGRRPGDVLFRRFELKHILGRGGMGVVWLAQDRELDRLVAVKFLPEVMAFNKAALADLKRETRQALELTHPHIVRIHDWHSDGEHAAVVMEYVDGESLATLRAERDEGHLEVGDIREWVHELCEALEYAHTKAGVVHRDLKPANLLVNGRGDLKVTDFGIARSLGATLTRTTGGSSGVSGSPAYMSPEQWRGKKASVGDDIYALGATLYELLTGKPPFYEGDIKAQALEDPPDSMAARRKEFGLVGQPIPPEWEAAVARCLEKDLARRTANARLVWESLCGAAAAPAPPPADAGPARESPAAPRRELGEGRLLIDQYPGEAAYEVRRPGSVRIVRKGRTPGDEERLPTGEYVVSIVHPHLGEQTRQVTVERRQPARLMVYFPYGRVKVTSKPAGATVFQDQTRMGATPLEFEMVRPGKVRLRLEMEGCAAQEVSGMVVAGQTLNLRGEWTEAVAAPDAPDAPVGRAGWLATAALVLLVLGGVGWILRDAARKLPRRGTAPQVTDSPSVQGSNTPVADKSCVNGLGMELIWIAPGRFAMGSANTEAGRYGDEGLVTQVRLARGFWLGKHEVTQSEYEAVAGNNPSNWRGSRLPVERVNWNEAVGFCLRLTERERNAGRLSAAFEYRLPTEAQWEYACRAGTTTRFAFGDDLGYRQVDKYVWYSANSSTQTHPVGQKQANPWGLHDMHGNVWEWCADRFGYYPGGSVTDPTGAKDGSVRVLRGGSFLDEPNLIRSACRGRSSPATSLANNGFRVALVAVP